MAKQHGRRSKSKSKSKSKRGRASEPEFAFPPPPMGWGGARTGAGRKREPGSGVPHLPRPSLNHAHPVHLTWRLVPGLPNLRGAGLAATLREALEGGCDRFGFRLVHFSIQSNHLHLIAEAAHRRSLWRGMQGLGVRIAKAINKALGRSGRVLADRYHAHQLRTPREVRNALRYVLNNAQRHGGRCARPDPCSSGPGFNGWRGSPIVARVLSTVCAARTWLLEFGWRRHGLIALGEIPGPPG